MILGFAGYRHLVFPLLQTLSHGTRAYIVNAEGLHGFVEKFDIVKHLREADETGRLEHARKWQVIKLDVVSTELDTMINLQDKMNYLSESYPGLFICILEHLSMTDKIEDYMTQCKEYENDRERYSLYIQGYLLIWLEQ